MNAPRRILAVAVLGAALTVLTAGPAMAHGRGSDASNFLSTITSEPDIEGVEVAVINSDEYLQVTNTGDTEVMIPGYVDEPYLRIGPDGVFRNRNSQATYVNEDRFGQVAIPPDVDPDGEPEWEKVSDGSSWAFHDHRIHWMATADPPAVQTAPGERHLVNGGWEVPIIADGTTYAVVGDLYWVPGGSALVWLIPAFVVVSIPVAVALWRTEPDVDAFEWRGLSTTAGAILLVLALANVFHLVDDLFATPIPIAESAVSALQTFFFIALAVFGAVRAIQGREGAFTALGVGAGAVFIGQGLLYFGVLSASQTASLFPGWLTRAVVAASVVQVIPLGIAAAVGTRRLLPEFDDAELAAEARGAGGDGSEPAPA